VQTYLVRILPIPFNLDREKLYACRIFQGSSAANSATYTRFSAPSLPGVSAGSLANEVTLSQVLEMVVDIIYVMAGLPGWNVLRASGGQGWEQYEFWAVVLWNGYGRER